MSAKHLIFGPLLALVLIAPLPFASVLPWAWGTIGVWIALLLGTWAIHLLATRQQPAVPVDRIWLPTLLFGLVVIWILIQIAPWTPESWHHPIWREASAVLKTPLIGHITVDAFATESALLRLLIYAAVFWLALNFGRDRTVAHFTILALTIGGTVYAIYGLVIQFSGSETVLWATKTAYLGSLTSTFINRNSYATYAGICLICTTALIAREVMAIQVRRAEGREKVLIITQELVGRNWWMLLAWVLVATALFLTNSRAGVVSGLVGLVAFLGILTLSPLVPARMALRFAFVFLIAGVAFFWISGDTLTERLFGASAHTGGRIALYRLTIQAISDAPLLGMGFGTFDQVFELYRGDTIEFQKRSAKAHSTYLEAAMELGIPAACVLVLAIASLVWRCFRGVLERRRDIIYPVVGVSTTILVALHSTIDFSLQNPAVAITYSFLLGIACAQSWSSKDLGVKVRKR